MSRAPPRRGPQKLNKGVLLLINFFNTPSNRYLVERYNNVIQFLELYSGLEELG